MWYRLISTPEPDLEIVQDLEDLYVQEDQNAVFMCEVSLEDVPADWYKDGHKIRPSTSIKIRTEGEYKDYINTRYDPPPPSRYALRVSTKIILIQDTTLHIHQDMH